MFFLAIKCPKYFTGILHYIYLTLVLSPCVQFHHVADVHSLCFVHTLDPL